MGELSDKVREDLIIPDKIEVEYFQNLAWELRYKGCKFFKNGNPFSSSLKRLIEIDCDELTDVEIIFLSHGSEKINFRGCPYALDSSESSSLDNEAVKRYTYVRKIASNIPEFL